MIPTLTATIQCRMFSRYMFTLLTYAVIAFCAITPISAQNRAEEKLLRQISAERAEYFNRHLGESQPYTLTRNEEIVSGNASAENNGHLTTKSALSEKQAAPPIGVAQRKWSQLGGPEAAQVRALLERNGRILAGTLGGIYYSDDQGESWQLSGGSPLKFTGFRFVTLGDAIFTGIDNLSRADGPAGGVLRSRDNGMTWEHLNVGLENAPAVFYLEKWQNNTLLASTAGGLVFRSTDNGDSWQPAMNGLPQGLGYFYCISSSRTIIATSGKGLFRSLDGGLQWEDINASLPAGTELVPVQSPIALGDSFVVYAGAGGVLLSDNNGTSWRAINNGLPVNAVVGHVALFGNALYASLADGSAYLSTDQGANWKKQNDSFAAGKYLLSAVAVNNQNFIATLDGVYRSEDNGQTWQRKMSGMRASFINGGVFSVGRRLFAAAEGGIWASDNKGASWRLLDNGFRHYPLLEVQGSAITAQNGFLFAGSFNDGLYRSADGGGNFERMENGLPARWSPVFLKTLNNKIYAGDYSAGAYVSADDGASWTKIRDFPEDHALFSMGSLGGGKLLAGGYPGKVYRSDNNGESWYEFHTGINIDLINDFINVGASCLVGTDDGIYRMNNDDTGWTQMSNSETGGTYANGFGRLGNAIYASTFGNGIYVSYDNGVTWGNFNLGMNTMRGFFFTWLEGDLYFGSGGASMWVLRNQNKAINPF